MNDSGYMLLEVLILILVLLLIIRIMIPILDTIINMIRINEINDYMNDTIINFSEGLKLMINREEIVDIVGIDLKKIKNGLEYNEVFQEEFLLNNKGKEYMMSIYKDEINEKLWEMIITLKEIESDEGPEVRIIFKK